MIRLVNRNNKSTTTSPQPLSGPDEPEMAGGAAATATVTAVPARCATVERALVECVRKVKDPIQKEAWCRHLSRKLAECLVTECCPEEAEAVRGMCASSGTSAKRAQCRDAKFRLSACMSALQTVD